MIVNKLLSFVWVLYFLLLGFLVCCLVLSQPNMPIQAFVIQSGSMEPTIMTGDLALIKTVSIAPKINDVITFKNLAGTTVTHRIIEEINTAEGMVFITEGDNNHAPDPDPVPLANIKGVWFLALPKVGYFLVGLRTALGMSLLVGLPVILIIIGELKKKPKATKKDQAPVSPSSVKVSVESL